jgi:uncharacterized iron-regulated membrane protein
MTVDKQFLIWGAVVYVIMIIFASALAYLFFWCWKKRVALTAMVQYSRAAQPIRYWSLMLFYVLAFLSILTALYIRGRELIELLLKLSANH